MKFSRRIKLFLFGVIMGTLIVYISLIRGRDRDLLAWLPEERVLQELRDNELIYTQYGNCSMECANISKEEVQQILINGEVIFNKSEVKKSPCPVYTLEGEANERQLRILFASCDKETKVLNVIDLNNNPTCDCK